MIQSLFALLLILFHILCGSSQFIDPIQIKISQTYEVTDISQGKSKYFVIKSNDLNESNSQYLFFIAQPLKQDYFMKTQIILSKINTLGKSEIIIKCSQIGIDSCSLNQTILRQLGKQDLHIQIKSSENISLKFFAYWDDTYPLKVGNSFLINFQDTAYAKVFSLDISNFTNFKELRIILKAKTFLKSTDPIHMYVNYMSNEVPSKDKYDFTGSQIWNDGLGIFIAQSQLKQKKFKILIEGPALNQLILKPLIINNYLNEISINSPAFDHLKRQENRKYLLNFSSDTNASQYDIYIKAVTFTGSINIQIFADSNLTQIIHKQPLTKFGNSQYKISKQHRKKNKYDKQMYIQIYCRTGECSFMVSAFYKTQNYLKLNDDIMEISELDSQQIDYYYVNIFNKKQNKDSILAKFILKNFIGSEDLKFFMSICNQENISECIPSITKFDSTLFSQYDTVKPYDIIESSGTINYHFKMDPQKFQKTQNKKITKLTLLIMIVNFHKVQKIEYSLTYIDQSRISILRENYPVSGRISIGETKYYKFLNIDAKAKEIRFHLVSVVGSVGFFATREDPRNQTNKLVIYPFANLLIINTSITDPVYISVDGQQSSLYNLNVQIIREQQNSLQQQIDDSFNFALLSINVQHKIMLPPNHQQVLLLIPQVINYEIQIDSILPLEICGSYKPNKKPIPPNCDFIIKNSTYRLNNLQYNMVFLGIKNLNDKNTFIGIKYIDSTQCDQKHIGEIWTKLMDSNKKYCITYGLLNHQATQISINLLNLQYNKLKIHRKIGSSNIQIRSALTQISKQQIKEYCGFKTSCNITLQISSTQVTAIQVVIQNTGKEIMLLDGIAQIIQGNFGPDNNKKFKFMAANQRNITIMVESRVGFYYFVVNIVNMSNYNGNQSYPTKQKSMFTSQNLYYSSYESFTIDQNSLKNYSLPCLILISVYHSGQGIQQRGIFYIQITQQIRFLKEHSQALGYLEKDSLAYYGYYFSKSNGSIIISLSSQNNKCAYIYLTEGEFVKATKFNNIGVQRGSQLIYSNALSPNKYSITVQAFQNCQYTISVSSNSIRIYQLTTAIYRDLTLEQNQTMLLYYNSLIDESFKVMSLQKYGQVMISAVSMDINEINNLDSYNSSNDIDTNKFTWNNQHNILKISNNDKGYCFDCFYLIAVKALRRTETSIIISMKGMEIPLSSKKNITDKLDQKQTIKYKVYDRYKQVNLIINIFYGQLNVTIYGAINSSSKILNKTQDKVIWPLKINNDSNTQFLSYQPIYIQIQGLVVSLYQISLQTSAQLTSYLKQGYPTHIYFYESLSQSCSYGSTTQPKLKLILTTSMRTKKNLQGLKIKFSINETQIFSFQRSIIQNAVILDIDMTNNNLYELFSYKLYKICFHSANNFSLTVIPVSNITYFPEKTSVLVQKEQNFTFSPDGKTILEVFECSGTASILISRNYNKLRGSQSQINHWRKFGQNYIVQIQHWGPTYLNVKGDRTLIKWIHVNEGKGQGLGYHIFKIPHYRYMLNNNKILFEIQPISAIDKSIKNYTLNMIKYTLFVGKSQYDLKAASQCNIMGKLIQRSKSIINSQTNIFEKMVEFEITYDDIDKQFNDEEYVFSYVVAEVEIITRTQKSETYKFIYDEEQISYHIIAQQNVLRRPSRWRILIFIIMWACIGILLYILIKWIIKKVKRHRDEKKQSQVGSEMGDVELKYSNST